MKSNDKNELNLNNSLEFETNRILLRPLTKDDVDQIYEIRHSNFSTDMIDLSSNFSQVDAQQFVNQVIKGQKNGDGFFWCIVLKSSSKVIGTVSLWNLNKRDNKAELAYEIGKNYQKKAFAHEACKLVLSFAFKVLGLSIVEGVTDVDNHASIGVLNKFDFSLSTVISMDKQAVYYLNRQKFIQNHPYRAHEIGIDTGHLKKGPLNKITDVKGVRVGHFTINAGAVQTGVTVVMPSADNVFENKLLAASHVINGFGKTTGLVQIEELGTIESPIALTNTLAVGRIQDAMIDYMVARTEYPIKSINALVGECNDSYLNDITHKAIQPIHLINAIEMACEDFNEGAVGAGRGMSCHHLKGGIGSASRAFEIEGETYTLGVMVLSNHGILSDLVINHKQIGKQIQAKRDANVEEMHLDRGSCMIIIATDLPVSERQLKRICKRSANGLSRLGSFIGHGSGEIAIGFSTANKINISGDKKINQFNFIVENQIDIAFRAVTEATEEAVINSMLTAESVEGVEGHIRQSLNEYMNLLIG